MLATVSSKPQILSNKSTTKPHSNSSKLRCISSRVYNQSHRKKYIFHLLQAGAAPSYQNIRVCHQLPIDMNCGGGVVVIVVIVVVVAAAAAVQH
jgi:hypothetical protein